MVARFPVALAVQPVPFSRRPCTDVEKKGDRVKWLTWIVVLAVLAAGGWYGWQWWTRPQLKSPDFRTAIAARGDITQSVTATGPLNPIANVQVGSQISGMILRLHVDFNSSVTQGQVIAELDSATYRAALLQAEGELANARAGLELARIEARRAGELKQSKLIPEAEHDKAQADLHQAEAQVMIRQAALERARVDLGRCTILAPTNGIVISRNVDVGQTVAASLQAPTLFLIANDLAKMQIDAMVSEADIGGVEVGQAVIFTVDAFPARTFSGKVMQIRNAPTTNQNVVTYDTVVEVENRDLKLKPGMTANVSIILAEHQDVVKIPGAALRYRPADTADARPAGGNMRPREGGGGPGGPGRGAGPGGGKPRGERMMTRTVYTLPSTNPPPEGVLLKPEPKQIRAGISDGTFIEVLEGLEEGAVVVTGASSGDAARSGVPGATSNPLGGGPRRF
jgi:HlyD family secretion protein